VDPQKDNIQDFIKDPYVMEFLNLPENQDYRESELEKEIIDNPQAFLLEIGKGFSFAGRRAVAYSLYIQLIIAAFIIYLWFVYKLCLLNLSEIYKLILKKMLFLGR
jgi:predicted nuclease of restriction endonuclease-like (RecB) superfamily